MIQRRQRPHVDTFAAAPTYEAWIEAYDRALPWAKQGACWGRDDVDFFAQGPKAGAQALALCANCPVKAACLEHAIAWEERGIWGGTFDEERLKMRKRLSGTRSA